MNNNSTYLNACVRQAAQLLLSRPRGVFSVEAREGEASGHVVYGGANSRPESDFIGAAIGASQKLDVVS